MIGKNLTYADLVTTTMLMMVPSNRCYGDTPEMLAEYVG